MSLLFCDSFDHYDTAHAAQKWDVFNSIVAGGRQGNAAYSNYQGAAKKNLPNAATMIVGAAFNPSDFAQIFAFADQVGNQVFFSTTAAGGVAFFDGNSVQLGAASANGLIRLGIYQYVECKITFAANGTGSAIAHVNGVAVLSVTSITTSLSGNAYANAVFLQGNNGSLFDDFYVCDSTGTTNRDFLGDVKVVAAFPNANGRVNQFTRTGGTSSGNFTAVSEQTGPDNDTSYVASGTQLNSDTYGISSIGTVSSIKDVQIVASARKDDAGTRVLGLGFGNGTTENYDAGTSLPSNYTMLARPLDQNPITGVGWVAADLTAGQIAVKVIS